MIRICRATYAALLAGALCAAGPAGAAFIDPSLPGTAEYEGWADLTAANFPGYGSFPGSAPWPAPIGSTEGGSAGNAELDKLAGNGYPATVAVYAPFTHTEFAVRSAGALGFDIETVVFQIDLGPGENGGHFDFEPTLDYNGGSQALAADLAGSQSGDYPFVNPIDPTQMGTTTAFQFQWDLSALGTVSSYEIQWTGLSHAQTYELQVDVGDTFVAAVTPDCADGIDDDGDGLVDLADPGCDDANDGSERSPLLLCDDGIDNDGDGRIDHDPATSASPGSATQDPAGFGDPVCRWPAFEREDAICQNGVNDDNRFGTDYDGGRSIHGAGGADPNGADPTCGQPWFHREQPACGVGFEVVLLLPLLVGLRRGWQAGRSARA